ncbi:ergosterol biosynthetic protein 28 homolog isoform X1 [Pongo abelii]|uniref:ergosterol biosynthetic protein 28 homolog isoform X1 n=1 Tax=Pongo abelii TaxID=9601 RepID=UPI0004F3FD13|nr:ergosterol biosynthetic protein 28 homolog isoform X1 [Pongo abelii]XP_054304030.1 ergosterol biosynthetic protein 28 homolog isoform X2 [Pongo pygmaeus]
MAQVDSGLELSWGSLFAAAAAAATSLLGVRSPVNGLQARTFGIWTLLSSVIRCLCAIDIHNKTLYHITLWTFLLALGHFLSELFVYGTAAPTIGVLAPLMVASFSILGMLVGLRYLEVEPVSRQKKRN